MKLLLLCTLIAVLAGNLEAGRGRKQKNTRKNGNVVHGDQRPGANKPESKPKLDVPEDILHKDKDKSGPRPGAVLTDEERRAILAQHNYYRRNSGASNMEYMFWNYELEAFAQKAAEKCQYDHTTSNARKKIPGFKYAGENIYSTSAHSIELIQETVQSWNEEIEDYDFDTNGCTEGKACGHYTQVVWAQSNAVGCGKAFCPDLWNGHGGSIVFCNYGPGGNWYGKKPYTKGKACSNCPSDKSVCYNGLCTPKVTDQMKEPKRPVYTTGDAFCKKESGKKAFVCTGTDSYKEGDHACTSMFCAANGDPSQCTEYTASHSDGLPCEPGKICMNGLCETDSSGSTDSLVEGCIHGDQKKVSKDGSSKSCSSVVSGECDCQTNTFGGECCSTCKQFNYDPNCTDNPQINCAQYAKFICKNPSYSHYCCSFCKCHQP